jgi:hypothetical protein
MDASKAKKEAPEKKAAVKIWLMAHAGRFPFKKLARNTMARTILSSFFWNLVLPISSGVIETAQFDHLTGVPK